MLFIDYLLRPENAIKNMNYLYYPFPVKDALPAFADLAKDVPACNVEVKDLENQNVFRLLGRRRGPAPRGDVDRSEGELRWPPTGHPTGRSGASARGPRSAPGSGAGCSRCRPPGW